MKSAFRNIDCLPLELLQEVSLHLEQHDVGHLRLASSRCSKIGVQYMLRTLPLRLTFDGTAHVLAISEIPALANYVHKLTLNAHCEGLLCASSEAESIRLKSEYRLMVKSLASKYTTGSFGLDGAHWEPHGERAFSFSYNGPLAFDVGFLQRMRDCSNWFAVVDILRVCLYKFQHLREVSMDENGLSYNWAIEGDLSISEGTPPPGRSTNTQLVQMLLIDLPRHHGKRIRSIRYDMDLLNVRDQARQRMLRDILVGTTAKNKVQRISLNFQDDANGPTGSTIPLVELDIVQPFGVGEVCRPLLQDYGGLEEITIKLPYRCTLNEEAFQQHGRALFHLPADSFETCMSNRIRKLDLGHFSTKEGGLNNMLKGYHTTLRELKLTRVDFWQGSSWVSWFQHLRPMLDCLEKAGFHDVFREGGSPGSGRLIDMDAIDEGNDGVEPRTIGSRLGESCLARTPLDGVLRRRMLEVLRGVLG